MSTLDPQQLEEWLTIPADELAARSPLPLTILDTPRDVHRSFAQTLFAEIAGAKEERSELAVVVPLGPRAQFGLLAEMVNQVRLPLRHVTFFGMDNWLDWEGRPLADDHPCNLERVFHREFIDAIAPALRPRPGNVVFPSPLALDRAADEIADRGGIATTYAGFGFQGHIAFNEPPGSHWSPVTLDQLRRSRTRVVTVAVDTIIAHAQRSFGGNVFAIPPLAVTLGMRDLLGARRVRLYADAGAWKQTILRILLFSEPTVAYPVTLVRDHRDVEVVVDRRTAEPAPQTW